MGLGNRFFSDKMLNDFEEQLQYSASLNALRDQMRSSIVNLGFEAFAYVRIARGHPDRPRIGGLTSYPRAWCERYRRAQYFAVDPTVWYCATHIQPVAWSDLINSQSGNRATEELFEEAQGYGLRHGITIPLHGGDCRLSAMNVATDCGCREASRFLTAHMDMIHIMALIFHGIAEKRIRSAELSLPTAHMSPNHTTGYSEPIPGRRLQ